MQGYLGVLLLAVSSYQAQALDCVCVMTSCATCPLNVRSGPSTASEIIGSVSYNDLDVNILRKLYNSRRTGAGSVGVQFLF